MCLDRPIRTSSSQLITCLEERDMSRSIAWSCVACVCVAQGCNDALFLNRAGHAAAGLDPDDAVLGSSPTPPIVQTISLEQR